VLRHHEKGKEPPGEILARAAAYTAFFSKARGSGKVPVTVTEKRHVRKPRKAPVGTVLVGTHRTILVGPRDPDKEIETA
jgi:predicted ribosome quality control (RQC) complex YloA/Tae2 family protein